MVIFTSNTVPEPWLKEATKQAPQNSSRPRTGREGCIFKGNYNYALYCLVKLWTLILEFVSNLRGRPYCPDLNARNGIPAKTALGGEYYWQEQLWAANIIDRKSRKSCHKNPAINLAPPVTKVTWLVGCFSLAGLSNIQWRHKPVDEIFSASMLYVMKFRTDVGWTSY